MTIVTTPQPDAIYLWTEAGAGLHAAPDTTGTFSAGGAAITLTETAEGLAVRLDAPAAAVSRVALRWNQGVAEDALILGDAWERSYGDLHWEHVRPERILPWYWLATSAGTTRGAGVRVRAGAFCSWTVDVDGITLWLDVRSGSRAVRLGDRTLNMATIVWNEPVEGGTAFAAQRELCGALCSDPLLAKSPLVGTNNWYYAYGVGFDADAVVRDAAMISQAAGAHRNRPYSVIDAGWSEGGTAPGGPWDTGSGTFSDMAAVADRISGEGAIPGLWFRPLLSRSPTPTTHPYPLDGAWPLDPSRPETLERVATDVARFRDWGFGLLKHDFSSYDVLGRFLSEPGADLTNAPWTFADDRRTTAEILVDFYETIRGAAGDMAIIGCNTVGHLAAGLQHAQRTGDDTSGRQWERTRRMGVNTLAFRLAQNGTFFTVDPDCIPSTPTTPWAKNRQFLDLVATSGAALFLSVDPSTRNSRVDADVRAAVTIALDGGVKGGVEPLDWQTTSAPRRWRVGDGLAEAEYSWSSPWGVDLSLASI